MSSLAGVIISHVIILFEYIEEAHERWRQETGAALSQAEEARTADEAARLAAAEAHWRESSGDSHGVGFGFGVVERMMDLAMSDQPREASAYFVRGSSCVVGTGVTTGALEKRNA